MLRNILKVVCCVSKFISRWKTHSGSMILEKTHNKLLLLSLSRTLYNAHCQQEFVFLFKFSLICIHKQVAMLNLKLIASINHFCISLKLNWWRPQNEKNDPLHMSNNFTVSFCMQRKWLFFGFCLFVLSFFSFLFWLCIFAWCKWTLAFRFHFSNNCIIWMRHWKNSF